MSDSNTRDIATAANVKIDQHMTDCVTFRASMRTDMREIYSKIEKLTRQQSIMIGGLLFLGKVWDMIFSHLHS